MLAVAVLSFSTAWCQQNAQDQLLVNAPNVQKRDVGSFHAVEVSSAIDLIIKQGSEDAVAVSATDVDVRNKIITRVENGVLKIYIENNWHWNWGWHNEKMKAFVSIKNIDMVSASGSSDVYVDGSLKADNLSIHISGSSDFKGTVTAGQLEMHQSGSSDSHISGTATTLHVHLSGASDLKGYGLAVDNCSVEASGSSDVQITVNKELNVQASGSSDVYYKGSAVIREFHTSGSSSLSKKS